MINNTELAMNAKLKQLKLMALEKFASNHGLKLTHLGDLDPKSQEEVDALYAEMIVRECASYMYEHYPHSRYEINYMRKHMGDKVWNKPIGEVEE